MNRSLPTLTLAVDAPPAAMRPGRAFRLIPLGLLAVCGLLAACGGSSTPPSGVDLKTVEAQARTLVDASPEMRLLFRPKPTSGPAKLRLEVFVDQSASMRGYVDYEHAWGSAAPPARVAPRRTPSTPRDAAAAAPSPDRPATSAFIRLLRALANEEELLGYYGFGSIDAKGGQPLTQLGKIAPTDPKAYARLNNDYADLLQQFTSRPVTEDGEPIERVIITDGVQSHHDLGAGSALSQTVQKLREWTDRGGVVEVRLLSAPFAGTYYSEELRARGQPSSFGGRTPARPFIAISLLSSSADLPAWDRFWARNALSDVSTLATLRCPVEPVTQPIAFEPEERIPKIWP